MKKTLFLLAAGLTLAALFLSSFSRKTGAQPADSGEPSFKQFLKQFPKAALPYSIDKQTLQAHVEDEIARQTLGDDTYKPQQSNKRLEWKYYEFLPALKNASRFSRMPLFAIPVAQFASDEFIAVLYMSGRGYSRNFGDYSVALFDKSGKHIATNDVAYVYSTKMATTTIGSDLTASTESWQINWEKDYTDAGFEDNTIKDFTLLEKSATDLRIAPEVKDDDSVPPPIEENTEPETGTSK
ncbi:MAG: hypothetical protein IPK76_10845 [Lewinellaceae bacterium]|nr:hypothetical protein [Lewinellaceae bacterium]